MTRHRPLFANNQCYYLIGNAAAIAHTSAIMGEMLTATNTKRKRLARLKHSLTMLVHDRNLNW